jgi:hypothetical protein
MPGKRSRTDLIFCPRIFILRLRAIVSTSGNSGMRPFYNKISLIYGVFSFKILYLTMKVKAIFCLLAGWLIPGFGHILQKRFVRGIVFFVCLSAMAAMGLAMGGKIYAFQTENPLTILAFFADIGNGLFFILSRLFLFGAGSLKSQTFEFGTAYLSGAGLLNYLVALDAFDIATGKKK